MLAKLLAILGNERAMKIFSFAMLVALVLFIGMMEFRERQAMLASYCEGVHAGQEDDWRGRMGYQCAEVTP
ncbi:hypothetical protein ACIGCM_20660 [Pseudomonas sp. NPDC078700]|uniref:hypothetical protein n=1 Tax=Pseudomonas sp. NPDC078700 TaxID=3364424 RepID=UPI0037C997BE